MKNNNNIFSIKRICTICTNCGYSFISKNHSQQCSTCEYHWREYLNYLGMKRGIKS